MWSWTWFRSRELRRMMRLFPKRTEELIKQTELLMSELNQLMTIVLNLTIMSEKAEIQGLE